MLTPALQSIGAALAVALTAIGAAALARLEPRDDGPIAAARVAAGKPAALRAHDAHDGIGGNVAPARRSPGAR